jgi:hypothetical protein
MKNISEQIVTLPNAAEMIKRMMKIDPSPMSGWQDAFPKIINSLAGLSVRGDLIAMTIFVHVCLYGTGPLMDSSACRREFAKKIIDAICDDRDVRDFSKKYLDDNLLTKNV